MCLGKSSPEYGGKVRVPCQNACIFSGLRGHRNYGNSFITDDTETTGKALSQMTQMGAQMTQMNYAKAGY